MNPQVYDVPGWLDVRHPREELRDPCATPAALVDRTTRTTDLREPRDVQCAGRYVPSRWARMCGSVRQRQMASPTMGLLGTPAAFPRPWTSRSLLPLLLAK